MVASFQPQPRSEGEQRWGQPPQAEGLQSSRPASPGTDGWVGGVGGFRNQRAFTSLIPEALHSLPRGPCLPSVYKAHAALLS